MKSRTYQYNNGAWSESFKKVKNPDKTWVLIFADKSILNDTSLINNINSHFENCHITGCSTSGEIIGTEVHNLSLSLMVMEFEKTAIKSIEHTINSSEDSFLIGTKLTKDLNTKNLKSIFIISDGLNVNGTTLVNGIKSIVDESKVTISGGLAGDQDKFESTKLLFKNKVLNQNIIAIGLYGEHVEVVSSSKGGWMPFGPKRKITKSKGNILYTLDDRPALEVYKEYLGDAAKELPASALYYPLSIEQGEKSFVRTILSVDEENQTMTFAGDIPEGHVASLMHANFDSLVDGASQAYEKLIPYIDKESDNIASIAVSCVGRKLVLGTRVEDETETANIVLGKKIEQIGFYSYGEIGVQDNECGLHNQTYTLTLIKEAA